MIDVQHADHLNLAQIKWGNKITTSRRLQLLILILLSLVVNLAGIRKNLPYIREIDEDIFAIGAVRMASTGILNPGFFGNPATTTFYPLLILYHLQYRLPQGDPLSWPDPGLQDVFQMEPSNFYLLGRLLSILYATFTIPLIYSIGGRVFSTTVGFLGGFLYIFYPLAVLYNTYLRSDAAATFFITLSLWQIIRITESPSGMNHLLAGIFIGLSTASRYFGIALILILVIVDLWLFYKFPHMRRYLPIGLFIGIFATIASFIFSSPYLIIDFNKFVADIAHEARTSHPGAIIYSRPMNFLRHIFIHVPQSISWPQTILAGVGVFIALRKRQIFSMLLAIFLLTFFLVISYPALNWDRWICSSLPIIALFVAYGSCSLLAWVVTHNTLKDSTQKIFAILFVVMIWSYPAYKVVIYDIQQNTLSTRVLARNWIIANTPQGSKIAQDYYAAPLNDTKFDVTNYFTLSQNPSLDYYYKENFKYLVASSQSYERYLIAPEFFPIESAFYASLFQQGHLLYKIEPSLFHGGPTVRIYILPQNDNTDLDV
jgi:hypothetical protein